MKTTVQKDHILVETEDIDFEKIRESLHSAINGFNGEYRWLSNFWPCDVQYEGITFPSVEHAYVYSKHDPNNLPTNIQVRDLLALTAGQVKRYGKDVELRSDWDTIKLNVMRALIASKFSELNPRLCGKLVATDEVYIEETNHWNDTFWGVNLEGVGLNHLGHIIMARRDYLRDRITEVV